ncbi:class I SAM-dependent methyltransferase [Halobaculum limi]|uniref:class I SAM-dependent methyltransferase n=1 Tax=Halobaculum limi TaxID=3031916 RepID=UPI00240750B5|nr:class I SAM-dependent methyltransferase [Halobaculum sp. YSMS11]
MTDDEVRAAYDRLAAGYDADGDTKPSNAYLERPAMRALLPTVEGTTVLDAGCGAGHLTAELVADGAHVVGLDSSAEMLRFARERAPDAAFVRADLGTPLPFDAGAFGGVASSLAFHYVPDWGPLFAELARVVRPGGWLTFTVQHPHADFVEYDGVENYHKTERVSATWTSFGSPIEVPAYRRPLESMITPALDVGFRLDRLFEPTPTDDYRAADPERYEYEATNPNFLGLRFDVPTDE